MKKIAIIITGDVRQCRATDILLEKFKEFDVFCGSYIKHANYIKRLGKTNKSILIDPEKDIRCPKGLHNSQMQQNMLQWLHMDNIIKTFKQDLLQYEVLLKFRFDCLIDKVDYCGVFHNVSIKPNVLYNRSDIVFYAGSETFIKAVGGLYDEITYRHKDNNSNDCFEKSWCSEPFFAYHLKLKKIINEEIVGFHVSIIRGNYRKVTADGK